MLPYETKMNVGVDRISPLGLSDEYEGGPERLLKERISINHPYTGLVYWEKLSVRGVWTENNTVSSISL